MTLASKITLIRVAFIPLFMYLMELSGGQSGIWMWLSLAVFILASITDYIDGQIARKCNQVSDFGKFLDPLADKLLVIAAMTMFCQWGQMPAWALRPWKMASSFVLERKPRALTAPLPTGPGRMPT